MRRILTIVGLTVLIGGGALAALGAGKDPSGRSYDIIFDNAFGLTSGASFKVGGVEVGSIGKLAVNRADDRARVTVTIDHGQGFGGLHSDAKCVSQPQSLIGEYFVDCQPGTRGPVLESGSTIPVERTESPIPADLVLDIMRMPERQRFQIILNELGAGLAVRGGDLNATIHRALPALSDTNEVLDILAANRRTLANLAHDSGQTLKVLGERRQDVGRFVVQAGRAARASANRRVQLAETIRRFPGFLDQLTPTMRDLGRATRRQTPALVDLREAAPSVTRLLQTLRPFSKALLPAITTLGKAALSGRVAAREARSLVSLLKALGQTSTEPANNLAIILNDLDDRSRAVETDPDSPGGKGYTGLEAPLQYIFDQSLGINIFDQRGYSLKINVTANECSNYTTAADAKADMARYKRCAAILGPNQPGITTPDPSPRLSGTSASARSDRQPASARSQRKRRKERPGSAATPAPKPTPAPTAAPKVPDLIRKLPQLLNPAKKPPQGLGTGAKSPPPGQSSASSSQALLDFLLSP